MSLEKNKQANFNLPINILKRFNLKEKDASQKSEILKKYIYRLRESIKRLAINMNPLNY